MVHALSLIYSFNFDMEAWLIKFNSNKAIASSNLIPTKRDRLFKKSLYAVLNALAFSISFCKLGSFWLYFWAVSNHKFFIIIFYFFIVIQ